MNGYSHSAYAASLAEFGTPRSLARSGGWLLERPVAGTSYRDAMGCYPLFTCHDWSELHVDLDLLGNELVSVAIVADPFGNYDAEQLRRCFPDRFTPFKEHIVTDLSRLPESYVDRQHRRKAQKALERVEIERCGNATQFVDEWNKLYATLVQRHGIRGLTAFSENSFRAQLAVPGISMFRAMHGNETVGMTLWYEDRGVAYYHLGAYSETGYEFEASFALFWRVIDYFANKGLQWLNLGAGAGLSNDREVDGLTRFKRGWATGTRTAYFCGRIFDKTKYAEAMRVRQVSESDYFPGYRKGEFG